MPSNHHFASAFSQAKVSGQLEPLTPTTSTKRKRNGLEDEDGDGFGYTLPDGPHRPTGTTDDVISHEEVEYPGQLPAQLDNRRLPPSPFPHTAPPSEANAGHSLRRLEVIEELRCVHPALHPCFALYSESILQKDGAGLKQRHLAVLTAILHRCLLGGDYVRAGRAWGMLLRVEVNGSPIDVRLNGLWGIGAEILLQRPSPDISTPMGASEGVRINGSGSRGSRCKYTTNGVQYAKDYYERLILQYPFRKQDPTRVNSLDFYPAMFGLWIHSVQRQHQDALEYEPRKGEESDTEDTNKFQPGNIGLRSRRRNRVHDITLQRAEEIAQRLETLLLSFPYSDQRSLWELRGMIALWTRDLQESNYSETVERSGSAASERSEHDHEGKKMPVENQAAQTKEARERHEQKAQEAFRNMARLSDRVTQSVGDQIISGVAEGDQDPGSADMGDSYQL